MTNCPKRIRLRAMAGSKARRGLHFGSLKRDHATCETPPIAVPVIAPYRRLQYPNPRIPNPIARTTPTHFPKLSGIEARPNSIARLAVTRGTIVKAWKNKPRDNTIISRFSSGWSYNREAIHPTPNEEANKEEVVSSRRVNAVLAAVSNPSRFDTRPVDKPKSANSDNKPMKNVASAKRPKSEGSRNKGRMNWATRASAVPITLRTII